MRGGSQRTGRCVVQSSCAHNSTRVRRREGSWWGSDGGGGLVAQCLAEHIPAFGDTHPVTHSPVTHSPMNTLPSPIMSPGAKVVERGPPWRQIVGEHPPHAPGPQYIADSVDHLPPRVLQWPPSRLGRWKQRFQQLQFPVAQGAGICSACHDS